MCFWLLFEFLPTNSIVDGPSPEWGLSPPHRPSSSNACRPSERTASQPGQLKQVNRRPGIWHLHSCLSTTRDTCSIKTTGKNHNASLHVTEMVFSHSSVYIFPPVQLKIISFQFVPSINFRNYTKNIEPSHSKNKTFYRTKYPWPAIYLKWPKQHLQPTLVISSDCSFGCSSLHLKHMPCHDMDGHHIDVI